MEFPEELANAYAVLLENGYEMIKKDELSQLEESQATLNCLEACGVDNWDGYDDAMSMLPVFIGGEV